MSARNMLVEARKWLGTTGRPNALTRSYASRHGDAFLRAPWCDISVSEWARRSGTAAAVLPAGDRAFTVWHAQDGERLGRWHPGTAANIKAHAKPGAVVFFDWDGTDSIGRIDHVGIVEVNLGDGRVQTIEGNSGDACKRRVRGPSVIAGFWNPLYDDADEVEAIVAELPLLKRGAKGSHVKTLFYLLAARGYPLDPKKLDDTTFGADLQKRVREFQKAKGLEADGEVGPLTWPKLIIP